MTRLAGSARELSDAGQPMGGHLKNVLLAALLDTGCDRWTTLRFEASEEGRVSAEVGYGGAPGSGPCAVFELGAEAEADRLKYTISVTEVRGTKAHLPAEAVPASMEDVSSYLAGALVPLELL